MCGLVDIASSTPVASRTWLAAGRVRLGHRSLAIIDGHQPMKDAYDVWGTDCLSWLNGMVAFALVLFKLCRRDYGVTL